MTRYVMSFAEIDRSHVALVGGKGAHLGELSRLDGIRVPPGFCVTTAAFRRLLAEATSPGRLLDRLATLASTERAGIAAVTADLRRAIEEAPLPGEVAAEITRALAHLGESTACAVRSSATAEDSPTLSFAGQQDSWLNIVGAAQVLEHVRRCWASLYTERAVSYRMRNGIDQRSVHMAVVVQQLLAPHVSGILFTADPITGNRKVAAVEASFGLAAALVSGQANADAYRVRNGGIVERSIAAKPFGLEAAPDGGTRQRTIEPERQQRPALTDAQVVRLVELGRRIEAHFGAPQDIEWCLVGEAFHIVQSRPITTLFPVPPTPDGGNHVYLSVGHQQMMTDAMKPLGISFWKLTSPAPMVDAGGRLFVDVTPRLASLASRAALLDVVGKGDPLTRDALEEILARGDFIRTVPGDASAPAPAVGAPPPPIPTDPAIVDELIARSESSIEGLKREIRGRSGAALIEFILADMQELRRILFDPLSHQAIMAGMEATWWLNERIEEWLGERNAADVLTQSVPHNVTSEMGLALLDVADAIRPHPELVAYLQSAGHDDFLAELPKLAGGREARAAIIAWLERYGMRCVGEMDITRPRWSERPGALLPVILANVRNFEPGEAARRFERGRQQALRKRAELLERLRALPDGETKADETARMIDRVRTFTGYREYPKYSMISRYFVYRQALLEEAARLVGQGVLREREDICYLSLQELHDVVRTGRLDGRTIHERRDAFRWHRSLTPPRVLTSDGELLNGAWTRRDAPAGALVGLPVSAGVVEGRARVILDVADAHLEPGDILVTAGTDPSWTPLFVTIAALVTEAGGLMTHGAVIAREYGLPAVVGVAHATQRIRDGQRIRVHGTEGYVELLE